MKGRSWHVSTSVHWKKENRGGCVLWEVRLPHSVSCFQSRNESTANIWMGPQACLPPAEAWASPSRDKGLLLGTWGEGRAGPPRVLLVSGGVLQRERFRQSRAGCGASALRPSVSPPRTAGSSRLGQGQHWPRSLGHVELHCRKGRGSKQSPLGPAIS